FSLTASCGSDDGAEDPAESTAPPEGSLQPAAAPSLTLRLDALVYADGDELEVSLDLGERSPARAPVVVLVGSISKDAEPLALEAAADGVYVGRAPLALNAGAPTVADGTLSLRPSEHFTAAYYDDGSDPVFADVSEDVVADFGLMLDPEAAPPEILAELALTDDEDEARSRPGTLLRYGWLPLQLATESLVLYAHSSDVLGRFLARTNGEVRAESKVELGDGQITAYLVEVDPGQADLRALATLRALFGEADRLLGSREQALQIATLAYLYQLEGFIVSVNPRLQYLEAPAADEDEAANVTHTMQLVAAAALGTSPCVPGDRRRPCVENVPAIWAFNELWDLTSKRIDVAVLDMGFAPNSDFRAPENGHLHQCDMTVTPPRCGRGTAEGAPTVGNSFFGPRSWHGSGVVQTMGGVVNNGFGAAGVGGQIAVPMLYKFDSNAYAFQMGNGIRLAVDDGASVINISAGYPCNLVTNIGADFDVCSVQGRVGVCALVTGALHAAAATTCKTLGSVPIAGAGACEAARGEAVAATESCLASFAYGELRGPLESAIAYAARHGVPVVSSAGNRLPREAYPEAVRDLVAGDESRVERWQIMPALIPECIVVGAVDANLANAHFHGARVDIWAPIRSAYAAPESTSAPESPIVIKSIGGTSAAAPYVTGLIAAMQAANPKLDPRNDSLSPSERADIVEEIRALLRDADNSFSNAELVELGYDNQPLERPRLVDPIAALRASASGLPLTGYDPTQGFSELLGSDDDADSANPIEFESQVTGTIVTLPIEGTSVPADVDFYTLTLPRGSRPLETTITLEYPADFGRIFLDSDFGDESRKNQYVLLGNPGDALLFSIAAAEGDDNVYRFTASLPEPAVPTVSITSPAEGDVVCADVNVRLRARARFATAPTLTVATNDYAWSEGQKELADGDSVDVAFASGSHTVTVTVFGDPDASDTITFEAQTCASAQ
ncbi:MAG TPA: S8 family serine peptidase, partial [Polyangiaceae bacterium]|nr:S8 family serine peptidase [Polyangiaceae bacterium]